MSQTQIAAPTDNELLQQVADTKRRKRAPKAPENNALAAALVQAAIVTQPTVPTVAVELIPYAGESFISARDKEGKAVGIAKDKTTAKGIVVRDLPLLSANQAAMILSQHDAISFTLSAACASFIHSELDKSRPSPAILASDAKAWKAYKKATERLAEETAARSADNPLIHFPQVWENLWSAIKGYLNSGGQWSEVTYMHGTGEQAVRCVRSVAWLKSEAKRLVPGETKERAERVSESLNSTVEKLNGGADGDGDITTPEEIAAGTSTDTARYLLDVAIATLGRQAVREEVAPIEEPNCYRDLSRVLAAYDPEEFQRALALLIPALS